MQLRGATSRFVFILVLFGVLVLPASIDHSTGASDAVSLGPSAERVWNRSDLPVREEVVDRTWMWGPQPISEARTEPYAEAPDGFRAVQYFDKSRMEINDPDNDDGSIWHITNGLLARELVTGWMQVGDEQFEEREPAWINVAGDPNDAEAPTYASFNAVLAAEPLEEGSPVIQTIHRNGDVDEDPDLESHGVTAAVHFPETNHTVASVFWDFMNQIGMVYEDGEFVEGQIIEEPLYATGYPITEPYWSHVPVGGDHQPVLIQVFERRVLTFTPENPDGWQVEAGNIGRHYHEWRYGEASPETQSNPEANDPEPESTVEVEPITAAESSEEEPSSEPESSQTEQLPAEESTYFSTLAPGATLPSGEECAQRVRRAGWEPRPQNRQANQTTGHSIRQIDGASAEGNRRFAPRVDGNFTGTTDEIIQWGACKWGFDEDVVRATAVIESWWDQATVGDAGQSYGLLQVKRTVHQGTYPASRDSTAFNVDYALAWKRSCFEGYFSHWVQGNPTGDEWACSGHWYAGGNLNGARDYLRRLQEYYHNRTWENSNF